MKKKKVIIIILIIIALLVIIVMTIPMFKSEGNAPTNIELGQKYICPMDCEQDKIYSKKGVCNVCNMPLIVLQTKDVFDGENLKDKIKIENKEKANSLEIK